MQCPGSGIDMVRLSQSAKKSTTEGSLLNSSSGTAEILNRLDGDVSRLDLDLM